MAQLGHDGNIATFPFGSGLGPAGKSAFSAALIDHIAHQYTQGAVRDKLFMAWSTSVAKIHAVNAAVVRRFKANAQPARAFVNSLNAPGFAAELAAARNEGGGDVFRRIAASLRRVVMPAVKDISYTQVLLRGAPA